MENVEFDEVYGTGEILGFTDTDTVRIGTPPIITQNQGFGEMYEVSDDFATSSCDGLYVSHLLHDEIVRIALCDMPMTSCTCVRS